MQADFFTLIAFSSLIKVTFDYIKIPQIEYAHFTKCLRLVKLCENEMQQFL